MKTYAIADLHGRYDLLVAAYTLLAQQEPGRIVHLGDYVDRGPESRQVVEHLMSDATIPPGFTRIVLKGNHEDIMLQTCRSPLQHLAWWNSNGGGATILSYSPRVANINHIPENHLDFLATLPLLHVDEHRVYVHAGVDPSIPLTSQKPDVMMWMIYGTHVKGHRNRHVVHGHHQLDDGPRVCAGRTNLDTGAYYTGRLVIGVFDDDVPGGAREYLEVRS